MAEEEGEGEEGRRGGRCHHLLSFLVSSSSEPIYIYFLFLVVFFSAAPILSRTGAAAETCSAAVNENAGICTPTHTHHPPPPHYSCLVHVKACLASSIGGQPPLTPVFHPGEVMERCATSNSPGYASAQRMKRRCSFDPGKHYNQDSARGLMNRRVCDCCQTRQRAPEGNVEGVFVIAKCVYCEAAQSITSTTLKNGCVGVSRCC